MSVMKFNLLLPYERKRLQKHSAMMSKRKLRACFLFIFTAITYISVVLGFNTFYYDRESERFINRKCLCLYSKLMALFYCLIFPASLKTVWYLQSPDSVTSYALIILTFVIFINSSSIYFNQTSRSFELCRIYNRALDLYKLCIDENNMSNVNDSNSLWLMSECVMRWIILTFGFGAITYGKFRDDNNSFSTIIEWIMYIYHYLPPLIITFASTCFYNATSFVLYLISVQNENLRKASDSDDPQMVYRCLTRAQRNHTMLHQIFQDFHNLHAKFIIFIMSYCIINVTFEVWIILWAKGIIFR
jgi:hypothetical protein